MMPDDLSLIGAIEIILRDAGIRPDRKTDTSIEFITGHTSSFVLSQDDDKFIMMYRDITNIRPRWTRSFELINPDIDPLNLAIKELKAHHIIPSDLEIKEQPKEKPLPTRDLDI